MKMIKIASLFLLFNTGFIAYSQSNTELIIIRWSTVDKGTVNIDKPYFYIINENSEIEHIDIDKEKLEKGSTTILIHKKLLEYYKRGYKLLSNNFSTTINGFIDKGEYILIKE